MASFLCVAARMWPRCNKLLNKPRITRMRFSFFINLDAYRGKWNDIVGKCPERKEEYALFEMLRWGRRG